MTAPRQYSEEFKANLVRRICEPGGPTAYRLSQEVGVSTSTLYEWVKKSDRSKMSKQSRSRRPQDWSASEKLEAVLQASALSEEELGRFLREKGLHEDHLRQWRQQAEGGLSQVASVGDKRLQKENQRLSKELKRKEKALAEAAALLVLSKKARALWGDEGEDT
ncbi:MAG: transposase [Gammaproteobacteria bacterium]|nr:transposase [Gammaproteobacteria bacterium]